MWFLKSVAGLCLVLTLVYLPGLRGGFAFDDHANILDNEFAAADDLSISALGAAAAAGTAGPLGRPLSMLSFAVNHALHGEHPLGYKITNLAIHVANAALVLLLAYLLLSVPCLRVDDVRTRRTLALLIALAWGLHPVNLTAVLYVVQRMTSLSSLFMLAGVVMYLRGRLRQLHDTGGSLRMLIAVSICTVLAMLSKESGALLPVYLLVCEMFLLRFQAADNRDRRLVQGFFVVTLGLPIAAAAGFLLTHPGWLELRYEARPFSLVERLLTEARVLWRYVAQILLPRPGLFGLFHDDVIISRSLFSPPVTVLAVLGIAGSIAAIGLCRRRAPLLAFAVAWFLGGHLLESTILPLEIMHDHRNYLASFGLLFGVFAVIWFRPAHAPLQRAGRLGLIGVVVLFALVTAIRAQQWSDPVTLAQTEAGYAPGSGRARYELGRIYHLLYELERDPAMKAAAIAEFQQAASLDQYYQLPLFALVRLSYVDGETPDRAVLKELQERLRSQPFHSTSIAGLDTLITCSAARSCNLDPNDILALFGDALENRSVNSDNRARILLLLGAYYANVLQDYAAARVAINDALAAYPENYAYRVSLIRLLIASGDYDQALAEIERARAVAARNWLSSAAQIEQLNELQAIAQARGGAVGESPGRG